MPKREEHILVQLTWAPWWVSVIFAAVVYIAMAYIAPTWLDNGNIFRRAIAQKSVDLAPFFGSLFLVPAFLSLLRSFVSMKKNTRR